MTHNPTNTQHNPKPNYNPTRTQPQPDYNPTNTQHDPKSNYNPTRTQLQLNQHPITTQPNPNHSPTTTTPPQNSTTPPPLCGSPPYNCTSTSCPTCQRKWGPGCRRPHGCCRGSLGGGRSHSPPWGAQGCRCQGWSRRQCCRRRCQPSGAAAIQAGGGKQGELRGGGLQNSPTVGKGVGGTA